MKLNPADEQFYKFLKQQLNQKQDAMFKVDANRRAKIEYTLAKRELTDFVNNKRKEGYTI